MHEIERRFLLREHWAHNLAGSSIPPGLPVCRRTGILPSVWSSYDRQPLTHQAASDGSPRTSSRYPIHFGDGKALPTLSRASPQQQPWPYCPGADWVDVERENAPLVLAEVGTRARRAGPLSSRWCGIELTAKPMEQVRP